MNIFVPHTLIDLLDRISITNPLRISFYPSHDMYLESALGRYVSPNEILMCGQLLPFQEWIQDNGTSFLFEQQVTLTHELLHRFNDLHGLEQHGHERLAKQQLEDVIDQVAYRLVREAGRCGFEQFLIAMSQERGIQIHYDPEARYHNAFYWFHRRVLATSIRRIGTKMHLCSTSA